MRKYFHLASWYCVNCYLLESKTMLGWNLATLRSFIIFQIFCILFLLCSLQITSDVKIATEFYRGWIFENPLYFALPSSESYCPFHYPQEKSIWGPYKTWICQNCHFANAFFSGLCSLWNHLNKRNPDNSNFYANERIKRSLCSLPLGRPNPPSPLTSQSAPPEGNLYWTLSVINASLQGIVLTLK